MGPTKDAEFEGERNGRNEPIGKEHVISGDSVPRPLGFIALMPIPVDYFWVAGAQFNTEPQPGLGPGVGAQVASRQSLVLRSVRL